MAHVSGNPTWTNTTATPVNATALENIESNGDFAVPTLNSLWLPSNNGLLCWSVDPAVAGSSVGMPNGYMCSAAIPVGGTYTATGIVINIVTANASLTSGRNFVGLYNAAGSLVGVSGDQTTAWASTGPVAAAFSGGPITVTKGIYYMWTLVNTSSGSMGFGAMGSSGPINYNRTVAQWRSGFVATSNTAMPSTAPTPTSALNPLWAALY